MRGCRQIVQNAPGFFTAAYSGETRLFPHCAQKLSEFMMSGGHDFFLRSTFRVINPSRTAHVSCESPSTNAARPSAINLPRSLKKSLGSIPTCCCSAWSPSSYLQERRALGQRLRSLEMRVSRRRHAAIVLMLLLPFPGALGGFRSTPLVRYAANL